ncbi:MAG: D-aminoacylase [Capsulimonadales bacterium]|nr:D-aminoacylase [Capsulimonadales bacterium]
MPPEETAVASPSSFHLLLRDGTVFDGLGHPPKVVDVGIAAGRIAAIGDLSMAQARQTVSARGRYVAPGFIDIHTHSDLSVLRVPHMESSLAQGVTAEVFGNCGLSLGLAQPSEEFSAERRWLERDGVELNWDGMGSFLRRIEDHGIAIHVATLAGHGTLRKRILGNDARRPDPAELRTMQRELARALDEGAIGLSSGLEYVPGMYADIPEMVALARVAREAGGFYATHLRDEGDTLEESVAEAIAVAEAAGIPLQLSHHKAERPRNWGKVVRTLAMVDQARARGIDILLDQYPYTAYQTGLATIALPAWAATGTPTAMQTRLSDAGERGRIREAMTGIDWSAVEIVNCAAHPEAQGKRISALSAASGKDPRDVVLDLLADSDTFVSALHFAMSEEDVERVLRDDRVMVGSDAVASDPFGPGARDGIHPRTYGTFTRVFARYVRERGLLTWEEAIRRMTSLPATRLGWSDRGRLTVGAHADIVVFDPQHIRDAATFDAPHQLAHGIEYVFVGGTLAFSGGVPTGARNGAVLRQRAVPAP